MKGWRSLIVALILTSGFVLAVLIVTHRRHHPPPAPIVPHVRLTFSYEEGDILAGFVIKMGAALTRLGIETTVRPNWQGADFFWHTAYRPDRYKPRISSWQNVFYNVENFRLDPIRGETILQTRRLERDQFNPRILYVPWAWVSFEERRTMPSPTLLLRDPATFDGWGALKNKTRFCAFLAQHCTYANSYLNIYGAHMQGVKLHRTAFFERLNATYRPVDALGQCHHNRDPPPIPAHLKDTRDRRGWTPTWSVNDDFVYMMRDYKFALSFENGATPGYITEKIINAYLGRTIPVYWGDPLIDEMLNTDAFIWCREWDACIARIKELDQDDAKYVRMLSAPILKRNVIPDWMSFDALALKLVRAWDMIGEDKTYRRPAWL